jgi:hypothetical protein
MKSIKAGKKDFQENGLMTFNELFAELKIDKEEI